MVTGCQVCLDTDGILYAHIIIPWAGTPDHAALARLDLGTLSLGR